MALTTTSRTRRALFPVLAVSAGLSIAGNYFAQPLLGLLRTDLGIDDGTAALLVVAAQAGYALGLALVLPLADRIDRRRLATALLLATAVLVALAGAAPTGGLLLAATAAAALTSVGAQVLVPLAAELGGPGRSGRAVGVVMSGVLLGSLVGRAAAGAIGDGLGWRSVYGTTAVLLVGVAGLLWTLLPRQARTRTTDVPFVDLHRSAARLLVELPALRRHTVLAALAMASYTVHLTLLTLLLVGPAFGWSATAVGAVGLLGAVGPLAMPLTGRLVDAGYGRVLTAAGLASATVAWLLLLGAGSGSVVLLAAGVVLLNLGQQAMLAPTQTAVYALRPDARNRLNAVFMTTFFAGGAVGGVAATLVWDAAGWTGACLLGAALPVVAATALRHRAQG